MGSISECAPPPLPAKSKGRSVAHSSPVDFLDSLMQAFSQVVIVSGNVAMSFAVNSASMVFHTPHVRKELQNPPRLVISHHSLLAFLVKIFGPF